MGKGKGNKNVWMGVGVSTLADSYNAAKEAAERALKKLIKKPVLSFVFYAGNYDPYKISNSLKKSLVDTEFVGGSAPSIFYDEKLFHQGVIVISFYSEFLRAGVASSDSVTKNPFSISKKTTLEALEKIHLDKYIDPYIQFSRIKKGDIRGIIRVPSFMLFVFTRGFKLKNVGREVDIINGVTEVVGQYVPIFGGSLGVPLDKVFNNEDYEIYTLHSGKVMKDGMVVVMVNSGLIYTNTIAHGCEPTDSMGFVTGVELGGYVVSSISNKSPIKWYSEALGINEKEFLKNIMVYTQQHAIAMPDGEGGYVMRAGGIPYKNDKMSFVAPFKLGTPVVLMKCTNPNILKASQELKNDIKLHLGGKNLKPIVVIGTMCASREVILKEETKKELKMLKDTLNLGEIPFVGFYSFGEIGSKIGQACKFNHMTANLFLLYDKLITDLPK